MTQLTARHRAFRINKGKLQIASSELEPPNRIYDADVGGLTASDRVITLTVGKRDLNDLSRLRTRLQIRMGEDSFLRYFWMPSIKFRDQLRAFLNVDQPQPADQPEKMQAAADFSDWANICSMAHASQYGVIDFHEIPPNGLAKYVKFQDSSSLDVRPVVRVQLATRNLLALLDLAETLQADIKTRVVLDPDELEASE